MGGKFVINVAKSNLADRSLGILSPTTGNRIRFYKKVTVGAEPIGKLWVSNGAVRMPFGLPILHKKWNGTLLVSEQVFA